MVDERRTRAVAATNWLVAQLNAGAAAKPGARAHSVWMQTTVGPDREFAYTIRIAFPPRMPRPGIVPSSIDGFPVVEHPWGKVHGEGV